MGLFNRSERLIVTSVTIGGLLEWYEFFLYPYLAPVISQNFFQNKAGFFDLINAMVIFAIGFISRPLGALFFGHIGDRYGRKLALIFSIIMITLPSFGIGLLPTYLQIGFAASLILLAMRLLQGFLVGGEISGAMCYLVEEAGPKRRRFLSSWSFFGPQWGAVLSISECLLLEKYLSHDDLVNWGWRLSFITGGCIGIIGCFLRFGLKETPFFHALQVHRKVAHAPVYESFRNHKKNMLLGFFISALPLAGAFLVFIFFPLYYQKILGWDFSKSLIISQIILVLSTLSIPLFGKINEKYSNKFILLLCCIGVLIFSYPLFFSFEYLSAPFIIIFSFIVIFLLTCYFAIFPLLIAELFPTPVRYTCIGLSYNLSSSVLGGTIPLIALYLLKITNNAASPSWILICAAVLSLIALLLLKEDKVLK